jgi:hypothetical protein
MISLNTLYRGAQTVAFIALVAHVLQLQLLDWLQHAAVGKSTALAYRAVDASNSSNMFTHLQCA